MSEDLQEKDERRGKVPVVIGISLALIAAVLVSISVDTYWLHDRIFDTENFVESLAPLPKDPVISTAVAVQAAESLDVGATAEQRIGDALPEQLEFLTPRFVEHTQEIVFDKTKQLVESDAFTEVWIAGLGAMHSVFIGVLDGDTATTETGNVGIGLEGSTGLIVERLEEHSINLFADVEASVGEVVVIQADLLAAPQSIMGVFHTAVWVFPLAALILLGIAVIVDRDPLRPIQWFGFGSAIAILISLVVLRSAVNAAGLAIDSKLNRAAADVIWTALLDGFVQLSLIVGGATLIVGVGTWMYRNRQSTIGEGSA